MDPYLFLRDLAVVTSLAAAVLLVFRRLGWPPVLGYLVAGLIIGPHTPPYVLVADPRSLEALAEIGVVFLLFALGSEFNFQRLARAGTKALVCAALEAGVIILAGWALGRALGWPARDALVLGGAAALASTAIVARTLLERAHSPAGWEELVAAVLIAEDMIAVLLIAFVAAPGAASSMADAAALAGRFAGLCMLVGVAGGVLIPRLLVLADRSGMEEVRSLCLIGLCFGVATLTHLFGFSAALGAFLAGAVASLGGNTAKLHETVAPFRDVFGAVFFVSIGMLIDPRWLQQNWQVAALAAAALTVVRLGVNVGSFVAVGAGAVTAAQASLAMLPIGEFSFILAQTAKRSGAASQPVHELAVALCLTTTLLSSFVLPRADERSLRALVPAALDRALAAYGRFLAGIGPRGRAAVGWTLAKPSLLQLGANAVLVAGIALVSAGFGPLVEADRRWPGLLWFVVSALSLPSVIAIARKAQAVALIGLETAFPSRDGRALIERRPRLGRVVPVAASAAAVAGYVALSLPLLPDGTAGLGALAAAAAAAVLLWRRLTRLYSLVQAALRENMSRAEPGAAEHALAALAESSDPGQMRLGDLLVRQDSWCAGRTLVETELRPRTGVMALRLVRAGGKSLVPGPDARLEAGDRLTLFGDSGALEVARRLLLSGPAA
ncbi:MAG: cation:proton antiporter [Elusimicrobiota bacterium]|nr:cation:proton antiporter [Elusimicrobiota bacterium]